MFLAVKENRIVYLKKRDLRTAVLEVVQSFSARLIKKVQLLTASCTVCIIKVC